MQKLQKIKTANHPDISGLRFLKFQRNTSRSEINIYAFIFHTTFAIFRIACCKATAILKSLFCGVNATDTECISQIFLSAFQFLKSFALQIIKKL